MLSSTIKIVAARWKGNIDDIFGISRLLGPLGITACFNRGVWADAGVMIWDEVFEGASQRTV